MNTDNNRLLYCRAEISPENDMELSGRVIRYGDIATLPFGKEVIDSGAFGDLSQADLILNRQHDRGKPLARTAGGGLQIEDSPVELRLTANLPETPTGKEAMTLVRSGVLRGFSVEFRALDEYIRDRVLHISKAELFGVALVDKPAYPDSQVFRHHTIGMEETDCGLFRWRLTMARRGFI